MSKRGAASMVLLGLLSLPACAARAPVVPAAAVMSPAAPATVEPRVTGVALPGAGNAIDGKIDGAPVVSVEGDDVRVEGEVVGDVRAIEASGRLQRVDGLYNALKARRETWKSAHPGESFPGVIQFAFDRSMAAVVVKSVFQTAAYAGYPNAGFLVRTANGMGHLPVDAQVPLPPRPGQPDSPEAIQRQVRTQYARMRGCYEAGLARDPKLAGKVIARVTIAADGSVPPAKVEDAGSTITDPAVVACVLKVFASMAFAAPGHQVVIVYPIQFAPSE